MTHTKLLGLLMLATLWGCGQRTVTKTVTVPQVQMVEVPVTIPGTTEIVRVPQVIVDSGFGVETYPRPIKEADDKLKRLAKASAKIMYAAGGSGSGFFISEDGLFLTNEHVIPADKCTKTRCPGIKIVRDFHLDGDNQSYGDFEVLAQSHADADLDFTLLKVKLPEGEKVAFLELELDQSEYEFKPSEETRSFKALGHPGGAGLRFTSMLPFRKSGHTIEAHGLVIPGNSGGALIDEGSGKVIGLIKHTNTEFLRLSPTVTRHNTFGRATMILDIFRILKKQGIALDAITKVTPLGTELTDISHSQPITVPGPDFGAPSEALFRGSLKVGRDAGTALAEVEKFIGTKAEEQVLTWMFDTASSGGTFNFPAINQLLLKQILLGRALKISEADRSAIMAALPVGDMTNFPIGLRLFAFDPTSFAEVRSMCLTSIAGQPWSYMYALFYCSSVSRLDGTSYLPEALAMFKAQTFNSADDFGTVTAFAMYLNGVAIDNAADKETLTELNEILDVKNNEVTSLMRNDAFLLNTILGVWGPGSFAETFPRDLAI